MQDNPRDFDYDHEQFCETCNSRQMGTEHHQNDAMGMATPVLWICHRCQNPPKLVAAYRAVKRFIRRTELKVRWWLKPAAEKAEIRERQDRIRKRYEDIKARRCMS